MESLILAVVLAFIALAVVYAAPSIGVLAAVGLLAYGTWVLAQSPRGRRLLGWVSGSLTAIVATLVMLPTDVKAQIGIGEVAVLLRILTQNIEINGKLGTNNKLSEINNELTKGHWNWHDRVLAAGIQAPVPHIVKDVLRIVKDRELGYTESELKRIEVMIREGRVSRDNRDDYEHMFSKVPDTPDALAQLAVDENTVHLLTKSGQLYQKLEEYKKELEALAREEQVSPHRADQIQKQQQQLQLKIQACQAQVEALNAGNQGLQTAMANKFVKDEKAAQLETTSQLRMFARSMKPIWMTDRTSDAAAR